jgi:hypothetical protein
MTKAIKFPIYLPRKISGESTMMIEFSGTGALIRDEYLLESGSNLSRITEISSR